MNIYIYIYNIQMFVRPSVRLSRILPPNRVVIKDAKIHNIPTVRAPREEYALLSRVQIVSCNRSFLRTKVLEPRKKNVKNQTENGHSQIF
jgi:hypothetical protein